MLIHVTCHWLYEQQYYEIQTILLSLVTENLNLVRCYLRMCHIFRVQVIKQYWPDLSLPCWSRCDRCTDHN